VLCLHARASDHPVRVESDSDVFHLGDALGRTEACFSMDRDDAFKLCGNWYKRRAKGVFCSTIGSTQVSISTIGKCVRLPLYSSAKIQSAWTLARVGLSFSRAHRRKASL
jgi:hypothetical protein